MLRRPLCRPLSRDQGARPARATAVLPSIRPSSGSSATGVAAVSWPTPGTFGTAPPFPTAPGFRSVGSGTPFPGRQSHRPARRCVRRSPGPARLPLVQPAFVRGALRYQLFPPPEQVFQLGTHSGIRGFEGRVGRQIKCGGVAGEDLSVQAVGFGLLPAGPGVGAHPVGMYPAGGYFGFGQQRGPVAARSRRWVSGGGPVPGSGRRCPEGRWRRFGWGRRWLMDSSRWALPTSMPVVILGLVSVICLASVGAMG